MLRRSALAGAVALALLASACNDDGRVLAPAPPTTAPADPAPAETLDGLGMAITSPSVVDGQPLNPDLTCDGSGRAPTLFFSDVPPAAAELSVAVVDIDAGGFVHWLVAGITPDAGQLVPDALPAGAIELPGSAGVTGWDPPCPPPGDEAHRYELRLYATAEPVGLSPDIDAAVALEALGQAAIEQATLTATYASGG